MHMLDATTTSFQFSLHNYYFSVLSKLSFFFTKSPFCPDLSLRWENIPSYVNYIRSIKALKSHFTPSGLHSVRNTKERRERKTRISISFSSLGLLLTVKESMGRIINISSQYENKHYKNY